MAPPRTPLIKWSQYLGARMAEMVLTTFEARSNLRTASAIGRLMYTFDKRHRERASTHIRLAFPEYSEAQVQSLTRESFEHFLQLVMEVCHTPRLLNYASWPQRTKLTKMGTAIEMLSAGQPAILLTGHLGNWEVLGSLLAILGYDLDAIARPIDNPLINDWLLGIRERRGLRIITKWNATDRMLAVLGRGGALGFIADQNAGDKGLFVPFFGKLASTYKSIGLLAISQNVPIICGYARRVGDDYQYEMGTVDIIYPEEWKVQPDPLFYVTARYMRAIETMVRQSPSQYLWMHRRWKSRPSFEKKGKPMPESLKENLRALPWMDEETMARLEVPFKNS